MKKLLAVVTVSASCLASGARAQDVASLAWMAGGWVSKAGDGKGPDIEERWIGPKGDLLAAVNVTVVNGRTSFEFLRIAKTAKGLAYIAQPGGRAPVEFPLKELTGKRVVFENLAHDFPQRVIYELEAAGTLHARVEGTIKGKLEAEDFRFTRSTP